MKKQIIIAIVEGKDWESSIYRRMEWEASVNIVNWEHDFVANRYVIKYTEIDIEIPAV